MDSIELKDVKSMAWVTVDVPQGSGRMASSTFHLFCIQVLAPICIVSQPMKRALGKLPKI